MKNLILIRHAKSDWPENTEDFDRPLVEIGVRNAGLMSKFLKDHGVTIDHFVASPALRTLTTAQIFDENFHVGIKEDLKLYNPNEGNFLSAIYDLQNSWNTVAFVSHNNGISNFSNSLTDHINHFPTCGVAGFEIDCDAWADFDGAQKKLLFFYEPKKNLVQK